MQLEIGMRRDEDEGPAIFDFNGRVARHMLNDPTDFSNPSSQYIYLEFAHPRHLDSIDEMSQTSGHASPLAPFPSAGVPGYPTFMPQQPQAIGSLLDPAKFPQNADPPKLFKPITIRAVTFPNRAWVAPMCQCPYELGRGD